jgi:hypothetical protein
MSRAVPVVVAAGLGAGVFCGLLFGLGTGKTGGGSSAMAKASLDAGLDAIASNFRSVPIDAGVAAEVVDAARAEAPTTIVATVTFAVSPANVGASIAVDGQVVTGTTTTLSFPGPQKSARVVVKAPGFRDYERSVTVRGDQTVEIKLQRKAQGASSGGGRGGGGGGGGIIDL